MSVALDSRLTHILVAGAVAVAVAGVVTSYGTEPEVRRSTHITAHHETGLPRAPTYTLERERHSDNRLRHPDNLRALAADRPELYDAGVVTEAQRAEALTRRARNRAYDGAPPTIPHPIAQQAWPNCMSCHAEGMRITTVTAPAICHTTLQNCVQCHVVSNAPMAGSGTAGGPPVDNTFVGIPSSAQGERAWPGAPPTMPHPSLMRGRCESCHGVLALGLRTSHPWRQSCTQCHAPSAALDQRPALALAP